jgi:hypothetical protein
MTKKERNHPSEFLNDLEEWQEHQYCPGHYSGGNLPPQLKYANVNKAGKTFGISLLFLGSISAIAVIGLLFYGAGSSALFGLGYSILLLAAGVKLLTRHRKRNA